jgi:hypothetical protein
MLVFATTVLMVLSTQCMNPAQHTGNGSDVGNGMLTGLIYGPDGKTAAVGAKVYLRKKQSLADTMGVLVKKSAAVDTATAITNENGKFVIDSVDTGVYVIESSDLNNNLAFKDSVFITDPDTTITVPPDTLKPAGALKGVIRLSEGGDVRKVFVLAFGIDRFARVNGDGSFRFTMLAEGKYDLRMIASLDNYGVLDTLNIPVISADTTNLDTVDLPFTGIPSPKNVSITYDTLKQIVTLTWDKADTGLVGGFNVYRRNVDSNTVATRINISPIMNTIYRDSTGIQDQTYEYKVTALDKQGNEGKLGSGVSVKVVGAFEIVDSIGSEGIQNGQFAGTSGIAALGNGNIVVLDYNRHYAQIFDSTGTFLKRFGEQGNSNGQFQNPIAITQNDSDQVYILDEVGGRVQKFDKDGNFTKVWTVGQFCRGIKYVNNKLYVASRYPSGVLIISMISDSSKLNSIPNIEPYGIDFDSISQTIFLVDDLNNRVVQTDTLGNILKTWGSLGNKLGQFDNPTYISLSSADAIYITDSNNKRVQLFNSNGEMVASFGLGMFSFPQGIAIFKSKFIYIADLYNYTIYKFRTTF